MHKPLFLIAAGSVAAVGALLTATALPAGAATAVRAETMAFTAGAATSDTTPSGYPSPFPTLSPCVYPTTTVTVTPSPGATPTTTTVPTGDCQDTPVTFAVTSVGLLAMTAPSTLVDLGSGHYDLSGLTGNRGTTIGFPANFGAVTVTDHRALDPAAWVATVSSTDFVNENPGDTADTIPASDCNYSIPPVASVDIPGAISAVTGLPLPGTSLVGSATDGSLTDDVPRATNYPTLLGGVQLSATPAPVVTVASAISDNGATWNPEIDVAVPANAVAGTYDGWVTHSVS